jgi:hypothetical protein
LLERSIDNEQNNSNLCHRMAEHYLGSELAAPTPVFRPLPVLERAGIPAHGLLSEADHYQAVLGTLRNVVIPGVQHFGVDTTTTGQWLDGRLRLAS